MKRLVKNKDQTAGAELRALTTMSDFRVGRFFLRTVAHSPNHRPTQNTIFSTQNVSVVTKFPYQRTSLFVQELTAGS
jgi:hypothetical protein